MALNRSLRRSLSDFRLHPWLHAVSIATVTLALVLLGGFFLCYRNFERVAEQTSPNITGTIYLREGVTENQATDLARKIESVPGVLKVHFKNRYSVLDELREFLGSAPSDYLPGADLFPDVLEVEVAAQRTGDPLSTVRATLADLPEVAESDFSEDWLVQYRKARHVIRIIATILMFGVVVGCSFIIANFMGMRHQARRNEIDITRLFGAREGFVLLPFLWEGIIEGVCGSALALIVLYALKSVLTTLMNAQWASLLGIDNWVFLSFSQVTLVVVVGILMAVSGSVAVFLRFQEDGA